MPAATAPIRPLAWEAPYEAGATLKRKKKKRESSGENWTATLMWEPEGQQFCPPWPPPHCQVSSQESDWKSSWAKEGGQREAGRPATGERTSIAGNPSCPPRSTHSGLAARGWWPERYQPPRLQCFLTHCPGSKLTSHLPIHLQNTIWYHSPFQEHSLYWRGSPSCSARNLRLIMSFPAHLPRLRVHALSSKEKTILVNPFFLVCLVLFCLFVFDHPLIKWKFPGQGSNLYHSSDPSHCNDNAEYLTHCTRELNGQPILQDPTLWTALHSQTHLSPRRAVLLPLFSTGSLNTPTSHAAWTTRHCRNHLTSHNCP